MSAQIHDLYEACDPRINTLAYRLRKEIHDTMVGADIPVVAIIGLLDLIKRDIIEDYLRS